MTTRKTRVLIVDDSAAIRQLLTQILSSDPDIDVVGTASDPYYARDKITQLQPDVLTLDIEMPRMDGLTFLEKLMRGHPMPVVMVSSLTQKGAESTLRALELGAVDFFPKPTLDTLSGVAGGAAEIVAKVKAAARARIVRPTPSLVSAPMLPSAAGASVHRGRHQIIAIGASTGGTEAIKEVLIGMPADSPGIVIVLHMPPGFTTSYAERLDKLCALTVKEAAHGDRVLPGHVLLAPGGLQTSLVHSGAEYRVQVIEAPRVSRHCPSVNVLFESCAVAAGRNAVAAILTGMGDDGACGLKAMRNAGARTIAQDEASCVVYGMPREAVIRGGAEFVLPLPQIGGELLRLTGYAS